MMPEKWTDGLSTVTLDDMIPTLWAHYPTFHMFASRFSDLHSTSEVMDRYGMSYEDVVRDLAVVYGDYDRRTVGRITGATHNGRSWVKGEKRVHPDDMTQVLLRDQAFMASFKGWYDRRSESFDALERSGMSMDIFAEQIRSGELLDIDTITELTGFHPAPVASKNHRKGFGGRFR